jgi:hypothetical protein
MIHILAEQYKVMNGQYPTEFQGIEELIRWSDKKRRWGIRTGPQETTDAWGNRFNYRLIKNLPVITSPGPDSVLGTDDDLIN